MAGVVSTVGHVRLGQLLRRGVQGHGHDRLAGHRESGRRRREPLLGLLRVRRHPGHRARRPDRGHDVVRRRDPDGRQHRVRGGHDRREPDRHLVRADDV